MSDLPDAAEVLTRTWLQAEDVQSVPDAHRLAATPLSEGEVERPQDFEPLVFGDAEANALPGGFWPYTVGAVGAARVIYHVLHPDRHGGHGFAIEEADVQAQAIAAALTEAGYLVPSPPPGEPESEKP